MRKSAFDKIENKRKTLRQFIDCLDGGNFNGFSIELQVCDVSGLRVDVELSRWQIDLEDKRITLEFSNKEIDLQHSLSDYFVVHHR